MEPEVDNVDTVKSFAVLQQVYFTLARRCGNLGRIAMK
jgi:hypothetical protein